MISVIVPVYKVEYYLPRCIESIINQTYKNIEIILVDDDSPDNCGIICDEYAKKDERIRVFHINHGGLSSARNYGIIRASGDYIGFVDSDDWIEPDMYEVLLNVAKENKADIVNCGFYYELSRRTVIRKNIEKKFNNSIDSCKALINNEIVTGAWNKLFHKSCFVDIRFPDGHVSEDIATVYKFFLKKKVVVSISKPLYHYRIMREGNITQTHSMTNLVDFWLAHKSRFEYFSNDSRFNTDSKIMDQLFLNCACAIGQTWKWYFSCSNQEKKEYASNLKEMHDFCVCNFPLLGRDHWSLRVRIPILIGRLDNKLTYTLLYYVLQSYRWVRNRLF